MFISRLLKLFVLCGQNSIRDHLLLSSNPNSRCNSQIQRENDTESTTLVRDSSINSTSTTTKISSEFRAKDFVSGSNSNKQQENILNLVVKHTILSSTAIISSQIFFNINVVFTQSFDNLYKHLAVYERDAIWDFNALAIDCVINILCCFLSFKFKQSWYNICCNLCHRLCDWCCKKGVEWKLKREHDKLQGLLSMHGAQNSNLDVTQSRNPSYDTLDNTSSPFDTPSSETGSDRDLETIVE